MLSQHQLELFESVKKLLLWWPRAFRCPSHMFGGPAWFSWALITILGALAAMPYIALEFSVVGMLLMTIVICASLAIARFVSRVLRGETLSYKMEIHRSRIDMLRKFLLERGLTAKDLAGLVADRVRFTPESASYSLFYFLLGGVATAATGLAIALVPESPIQIAIVLLKLWILATGFGLILTSLFDHRKANRESLLWLLFVLEQPDIADRAEAGNDIAVGELLTQN